MSLPGESPRFAEEVARLATSADDGPPAAFVHAYLDEAGPDDIERHHPEDLAAAIRAHWEVGRQRKPGTPVVRLVEQSVSPGRGWHRSRTLVLYITDDMPFLVDSVRAAITARGIGIHVLIHPMLGVRRDDAGCVLDAMSPLAGAPAPEAVIEGWTLIEIDHCDDRIGAELAAEITAVLNDVRTAVTDWAEMARRAEHLADSLDAHPATDASGSAGLGAAKAIERRAAELLRWMTAGRFVFLGAADYELRADPARADQTTLEMTAGTGLGLLRSEHVPDPPLPVTPEGVAPRLSILTADRRSTVHRPAHLTSIGINRLDEHGRVRGQSRFVGLFTAAAYRDGVLDTPYLRESARAVLAEAGFPEDSHTGRELRAVLEALPRDEFFELDPADLFDLAMGIAGLQERRRVRIFLMREPTERFVTALVYLPRNRFTSSVGTQVARMLGEVFEAAEVEHDSLVGASAVARLRVVIRRGQRRVEPDLEQLEERIDRVTVGWTEQFRNELGHLLGEQSGNEIRDRWESGIPAMYQAVVAPHAAVADLRRLERLREGDLDCALIQALDAPPDDWRFRLYRRGEPITLSAVLPLLEHLGVAVVDERPYRLRPRDGRDAWIYDIGIRVPSDVLIDTERDHEFRAAFVALFHGTIEDDGLNRLVLLAGLDSRQVALLRAYTQYLRQTGFQFAQRTLEGVLTRYPRIAAGLVELFEARFRPDAAVSSESRAATAATIGARLLAELDAVPTLEEDRIGRALLSLVQATTRTNAFRPDGDRSDGGPRPVISLKFDPALIAHLPEPRPRFEMFVSSPEVEGVHLRGGPVARGGLRWSDRRDDFRTEVLGLMKAQMVKNSVIVPVGAKGGFVVKHLPEDPAARAAEVARCYRRFVAGLLDVTDNIVAGEVVPPPHTIRYDGDDPYLVVAADKGTATFSDLANEVAAEHGFWLGDAFASGGSAGYDHKAMGITARGAWESVRRHGITLGLDVDHDPMTVVGVGDMSGDVFGNGMLLSRHLRLVAAFDHRHIHIDPDPDPVASFAERSRLFETPGSSWADYDESVRSPGGGVYPRGLKSITLSARAREVLGIHTEVLTPNELISAILCAPVDLLWNGGIGTYVKASTETHAEVGDRANDVIRVDAAALRCRMVGEGGNLGLTQRARIEYALGGGLINTDAIDNSAGVDCSDREVNIKILLNEAVAAGDMTLEERNDLLASMTTEVAELVLADNRAQTLNLALARRNAATTLLSDAYYIDQLEAEGAMDRALEFLPGARELAARSAAGHGLTVPEFAVILATTKTACTRAVLEQSTLGDDPNLRPDLVDYFPTALRERFADRIAAHPLRREILITRLVNDMVDISGITFDHWITEETGAPTAEVLAAWVAVREILDVSGAWSAISGIEGADPATRSDLRLDIRSMIERSALWLLRHERAPIDLATVVARYRPALAELESALPSLVRGALDERLAALVEQRVALGVPRGLARASAGWSLLHAGFDQAMLAAEEGVAPLEAARAYWEVIPTLDLSWLLNAVAVVRTGDRWETLARSALRDDVGTAIAEITRAVLRAGGDTLTWAEANEVRVEHVRDLFREIRRRAVFDLTTLTVATRQLHNLALT